ncbi:MAG: ABC transporter family substrate-binding protein [Rhodococcus sp. (in: high G+C Gram-positive bacteria)]|uniref:ABC transporter family substrate-binding protein n=1 Tax=Rhodococcus sp. BS-15 TaxID=1304954 RepID=UPI000A9E58D3|nr:ABC transporter family substrate-binding protein [Rhodococcus sp. BS-15]
MRVKLFRALVPIAVAVTTVGLVAGCSSGDTGPNPDAPASFDSGAQINPHPISDLQQGGNMNFPLAQVPQNYNYYQIDGTQVDTNRFYQALMPTAFHAAPDASLTVAADFFTDISESEVDGKQVVTYNINPKAKWSTGRPLDYTDLVAQWTSMNGMDPAYEASSTAGYDQVESVVRGENDQQVILTFAKKFGDWRSLFTPLMPAEATNSVAAFNTGFATTMPPTAGPFRIRTIEPGGKRIVAERNPDWWGENPAVLDTVTYLPLDSTAAIGALQSGEIDYYELGSSADAFKVARGIPNVDLRQSLGLQYRHFDFNGAPGRITSDKAVRVALMKAIDRDYLATSQLGQITSNPTVLNNHFYVDGQKGYQANNGDITFDPEKAMAELDAAGWTMNGEFRSKDGQQLDLHDVIPADTPNATQEAQIIQQNLKAVGANMIIDAVPSDDFFSKYILVGAFDVTHFTYEATPFTSGSDGIVRLTPGSTLQNYGQIGSDEINGLLDKAAGELDDDARIADYNEADKAIWAEGHSLTMFQRPFTYATKSNLANFGAPGFGDLDMSKVGFLK